MAKHKKKILTHLFLQQLWYLWLQIPCELIVQRWTAKDSGLWVANQSTSTLLIIIYYNYQLFTKVEVKINPFHYNTEVNSCFNEIDHTDIER